MQKSSALPESARSASDKRVWHPPLILLEFSLTARAQGPVLGEDQFQTLETDPFLGAFTASGV